MPNAKPTPADMLEGLRAELAEVEKQMAAFRVVQRRHTDLLNAINAIQKLLPGGDTRPESALLSAAEQVMRMNDGLARMLAGTPLIGPPPTSTISKVEIVSPPRTLLEAAERVLIAAKHPMHIKELVAGVRATGITGDRSPEQVRTSLVPSLNRLAAKGDRFWKNPENPVYGLAGWEQRDK